jgi:hypothetical protein
MKKLLIVLLAVVTFFTACDEETFTVPAVVAPATSTVEAGSEVELEFTFTAEGGFKASAVKAENGTATIATDATASATTGKVVVKFVAGTTAGAGSVKLTLTDSKDQKTEATAVISVVAEQIEFDVASNISANTTWKTGKVYVLKSRIAVVSGVTLTIEPGVVVKGEVGTGANATALIVARGAKIMAEGTATSPIIFTSIADEIKPGQIASPNLTVEMNGLWGGLIVLGNAPISVKTGETAQIEGVPVSDQNGLYGGANAADNSGVIKFVSIRHGGANIGEGNEINGLTLGGVGNGTTIENVEIISNQDDGIEWFGGAVNVKNAIVWNVNDDAIDADQNWIGTLDNFVVINPEDKCFELDGPEGAAATKNYTIKNGTVQAGRAVGLVDNDAKNNSADTNFDMENVYFFDIKAGQTFDEMPKFYKANVKNLQVTLPAGTVATDFFKDGSDAFVTSVERLKNTVGADLTKFSGWSWASVSKALEF